MERIRIQPARLSSPRDRDFKPAQMDVRFKQWIWNGITSYCTVSSKIGLECFQHLIDTYNLEKHNFYRYLQLRNHFNKNINNDAAELSRINIFAEAYKGGIHKKLVSKIYSCIQSSKSHSTRAGRYDEIYRLDDRKCLSFYIRLYRLRHDKAFTAEFYVKMHLTPRHAHARCNT